MISVDFNMKKSIGEFTVIDIPMKVLYDNVNAAFVLGTLDDPGDVIVDSAGDAIKLTIGSQPAQTTNVLGTQDDPNDIITDSENNPISII